MPTTQEVFRMLIDQVPAEIRPLIPGFLDRREEDAAMLRTLLETTNYRAMQDAGHKLKGTGAGYGFDVVSELGQQIEAAAQERNAAVLRQAIERLAEVTKGLKQAILQQPYK